MSEDESILEPLDDYSEKLSVKEKFTKALVGESPRCPECSKILRDREIQKCDYCGFDFSYLESHFPIDGLPTLLQLHDFSDSLLDFEMNDVASYQSLINSRYPQFSVKICILPLQKNVRLRQLSLWMLNQCPLPEDQSENDKKWTILIITNSVTLKSCIATGYNADVFLPDENSLKIVAQLNKSQRKGIHARGYLEALESILNTLDDSKHGVKARFKKFKKKHRK